MKMEMNYNRGLYFKNELELKRAISILSEYGFKDHEISSMSPYEAKMHLDNEHYYQKMKLSY